MKRFLSLALGALCITLSLGCAKCGRVTGHLIVDQVLIHRDLLHMAAMATAPLKAGTQLYRFHDPSLDGAAYNPCKGGATRFAPLSLCSGDCLPTLYAATTLEAAIWESLFHDVPHTVGPKSVRLNKVASRTLSILRLKHGLIVAPLHAPDLHRIGVSRADLIETTPIAYGLTARWAEAFHRGNTSVAGLQWTSRRCDPEQAFVFFEDRSPSSVWRVTERIEVGKTPGLIEEIRVFARRSEITLTI